MISTLILLGSLVGLPPVDDDPSTEAARTSAMASEELKLWTIQVGADPAKIARARPEPVLRYSNPGVGRVYGEVFLFIADGRPEAVMAIYKWFTPWTGFEAEMQSLATQPLQASRESQPTWHPDRPGIKLSDVPEAPVPAASAVERGVQMKTIAGQFSARLVDHRVGKDRGEDQTLRLLTKPLYRFETRESATKDGALFAFVLGTDPEVFLLLETMETPNGPRWHYGLARMNNDPIRVNHRGTEVAKFDKVDQRRDSHAVYYSVELPQRPSPP